MGASTVVMIRRSARAAVIGSVAAVATMMLSTTAIAATTVGSVAPTPAPCSGGYNTVQLSSTGASYAVPAGGGSIASWSIRAGTGTGPVGLEVWRPTSVSGSYLLVGASPLSTLIPNVLNTFTLAAPIATQAGDLLGLRVGGPAACGQSTTNGGDTYGWTTGPAAAVGTTVAMRRATNLQLNVAATMGAAALPTPKTMNDCRHGGWKHFVDANGHAFKSQAACIRFVASHKHHHWDDDDNSSGADD